MVLRPLLSASDRFSTADGAVGQSIPNHAAYSNPFRRDLELSQGSNTGHNPFAIPTPAKRKTSPSGDALSAEQAEQAKPPRKKRKTEVELLKEIHQGLFLLDDEPLPARRGGRKAPSRRPLRAPESKKKGKAKATVIEAAQPTLEAEPTPDVSVPQSEAGGEHNVPRNQPSVEPVSDGHEEERFANSRAGTPLEQPPEDNEGIWPPPFPATHDERPSPFELQRNSVEQQRKDLKTQAPAKNPEDCRPGDPSVALTDVMDMVADETEKRLEADGASMEAFLGSQPLVSPPMYSPSNPAASQPGPPSQSPPTGSLSHMGPGGSLSPPWPRPPRSPSHPLRKAPDSAPATIQAIPLPTIPLPTIPLPASTVPMDRPAAPTPSPPEALVTPSPVVSPGIPLPQIPLPTPQSPPPQLDSPTFDFSIHPPRATRTASLVVNPSTPSPTWPQFTPPLIPPASAAHPFPLPLPLPQSHPSVTNRISPAPPSPKRFRSSADNPLHIPGGDGLTKEQRAKNKLTNEEVIGRAQLCIELGLARPLHLGHFVGREPKAKFPTTKDIEEALVSVTRKLYSNDPETCWADDVRKGVESLLCLDSGFLEERGWKEKSMSIIVQAYWDCRGEERLKSARATKAIEEALVSVTRKRYSNDPETCWTDAIRKGVESLLCLDSGFFEKWEWDSTSRSIIAQAYKDCIGGEGLKITRATKDIEDALATTTRKLYGNDPESCTPDAVRKSAESLLGLEDGSLEKGEWRGKCERIFLDILLDLQYGPGAAKGREGMANDEDGAPVPKLLEEVLEAATRKLYGELGERFTVEGVRRYIEDYFKLAAGFFSRSGWNSTSKDIICTFWDILREGEDKGEAEDVDSLFGDPIGPVEDFCADREDFAVPDFTD